jgi:hypothetical protein
LAHIDLSEEGLTATTIYLTGNSPDVIELRLSAKGGLEHCLEDFALVSGSALLQLAVVREVGTKASKEARIKAIHESPADADGKHLWVNEWARSG